MELQTNNVLVLCKQDSLREEIVSQLSDTSGLNLDVSSDLQAGEDHADLILMDSAFNSRDELHRPMDAALIVVVDDAQQWQQVLDSEIPADACIRRDQLDDLPLTVQTTLQRRSTLQQSSISTGPDHDTHKHDVCDGFGRDGPAVMLAYRAEDGWPVEFVSENIDRFGYECEDFLSGKKNLFDILHPDDADFAMAQIKYYSAKPKYSKFRLQYKIRPAFGEDLTVEDWTWVDRNADGEVLRYRSMLLDITERQRKEQKIWESERRLRDLVETVDEWIWQTDPEGRIMYSSPRVRDILGIKPERIEGNIIFQLVDGGDESLLAGEFERSRHLGLPFTDVELAMPHADGHMVFVEFSAVPYYSPDGALRGFSCVSRDISEKRRLSSQLQERNAFMDAVFDAIHSAVVVVDRESHEIVQANERALELSDFKREELIGNGCLDSICRGVDGDCPYHDCTELIPRHEFELCCRDGKSIRVLKTVIPIRFNGRDVLVHEFVDASAPLSAEACLPSENPNPVLRISRTGEILYRNPPAAKLLQRIRKEGAELDELLLQTVEQSRMQLRPQELEMRVGKRTYVFTCVWVDGCDCVNTYVADVTYKKIAEEKLIAKTKRLEELHRKFLSREGQLVESKKALREKNNSLRELNKKLHDHQEQLVQSEKMAGLGQLAAGVAHEINNPVGFVKSNIGTLREYIGVFASLLHLYDQLASANGDASQIKEKIEKIKEDEDLGYVLHDVNTLLEESSDGIRRVQEIVQNLKSFARVDESEQQMADVNDCLESTLKIVWNELKYNSEVVKDYGELPLISCFPGELNQVFMNLLVNASHAIEEKGTITISTRVRDDNVLVSISDTGKGIAKENLAKLFDPFFTTKEVGKGTGLGLAISHGIIEKHEGRIEVESELGKGTTFTIALPVEEMETA